MAYLRVGIGENIQAGMLAILEAAAQVRPKRKDNTSKTLTWTINFDGLTGPSTMAHFHGPAAPDANAGVVLMIGTNPTSPAKGTATLTDAQAADLQGGRWYINIHTNANRGGEIRGQVVK